MITAEPAHQAGIAGIAKHRSSPEAQTRGEGAHSVLPALPARAAQGLNGVKFPGSRSA